jgi:hypothetical protein
VLSLVQLYGVSVRANVRLAVLHIKTTKTAEIILNTKIYEFSRALDKNNYF